MRRRNHCILFPIPLEDNRLCYLSMHLLFLMEESWCLVFKLHLTRTGHLKWQFNAAGSCSTCVAMADLTEQATPQYWA